MLKPKELHERRKARARYQIKKKAVGRPRLSVHRSGQNIYAQIIDDAKSQTVVAASSLDADLRKALKTGADKKAAEAVGKKIAGLAKKAGVAQVVFDRGGYLYAGRVKALAEAARGAGLDF